MALERDEKRRFGWICLVVLDIGSHWFHCIRWDDEIGREGGLCVVCRWKTINGVRALLSLLLTVPRDTIKEQAITRTATSSYVYIMEISLCSFHAVLDRLVKYVTHVSRLDGCRWPNLLLSYPTHNLVPTLLTPGPDWFIVITLRTHTQELFYLANYIKLKRPNYDYLVNAPSFLPAALANHFPIRTLDVSTSQLVPCFSSSAAASFLIHLLAFSFMFMHHPLPPLLEWI